MGALAQSSKPLRSESASRTESEDVVAAAAMQLPDSYKPFRSEGGDIKQAPERTSSGAELERLRALQGQKVVKLDNFTVEDFAPQRWYKETDYYDQIRANEHQVEDDEGIVLSPQPRDVGPLPPAAPLVPENFAPERWYKESDYYDHRLRAGQEVAEDEVVVPDSGPLFRLNSDGVQVPVRPQPGPKPGRSEEMMLDVKPLDPVVPPSHKPLRSESGTY